MDQTKTITIDLKKAMLDKDAQKVSVLRMLVAELKNERIEKGKELTTEEELGVLKKAAKKRKESIEIYQKADRAELAAKETEELKVLQKYLPKEMSKEEVLKIVNQLKDEGGLGSNFGEAMKAAIVKLQGKVDGKIVAEAVKEVL